MSSGSKISRNVLANYIGVFAQITIAFFLAPFLVHTLGDSKYGIWTIVVSVTSCMTLLDLGIGSAVNRYVSKYRSLGNVDNVNNIISTAFVLFFCISLLLLLVSPLVASLVVDSLNIDESMKDIVYFLIIIMSIDAAIFILTGTIRATFVGLQKYDVINFTAIFANLFKAGLFYIFLSQGSDILVMGIIAISANILTTSTFFYIIKKYYSEIEINPARANCDDARKIFSFSVFTFLGMLANQIIYYSDALVIGYFLTAASVTYYTIPWSLMEYTKRVSLAISKTFAPAFSELEAQSKLPELYELYISGTKFMLVVSNLICIGVLFLGGGLISLWMGPEYREKCEIILMILFANQLVQGPQLMSYSLLLGLSKHKVYAYVSIAVSILNLVISIVLVQRIGLIGVAIGAAVPQILFHGIFVPIYTNRIIQKSIISYLKATYLVSVIPTILLCALLFIFYEYYYPSNYFMLLSEGIVCAVLYMLACYFCMANKKEKMYILNVIDKMRIGLSAKFG